MGRILKEKSQDSEFFGHLAGFKRVRRDEEFNHALLEGTGKMGGAGCLGCFTLASVIYVLL